jgi:hypothetical protein
MALLVPPPLPPEALARRYHLTASEVRVLDAVLKVSSVKAMAEMLGVSLRQKFPRRGINRGSAFGRRSYRSRSRSLMVLPVVA